MTRLPWLDLLVAAKRREDVIRAFGILIRSQNWKHYAFAGMLPLANGGNTYVAFHNYVGMRWAERYDRLPETPDDPMIRYSKQKTPPVAWTSEGKLYGADLALWPGALTLLSNAGAAGLKAGLAVPCRARDVDWAFIILAGAEHKSQMELEERLVEASLFGQHALAALINLVSAEEIALTRVERDCLSWHADGFTAEQIAPKVGLSRRTVHKHLQGATQKLGARSLTHACVIAARRRLLSE